MGKIIRNISVFLSVFLSVVIFCTTDSGLAADRMFFSGISTLNRSTGGMDVVITWGELEGRIPDQVIRFNIYRKDSIGDYQQINTDSELLNGLVGFSKIRDFFNEPGEGIQKKEIISMLANAGHDTSRTDYPVILHSIMDPASDEYNPLQKQFLVRYSRDAARAAGRAYIDRSVSPAGKYTYMITGVLEDGTETNPLGRFIIDTNQELILPAPDDFEQVLIGKCSDTRKNLDHARVYLDWTIPGDPGSMPLRALTYGYDLFRSDTDLGSVNLRQAIPSGLTRVNDVPIIVSGNAPEQGLDAYLAKDDGGALTGGAGLVPGTTWYYYLVARDLAGKYSDTAGPLEVIIPDKRPPAVPWNVHSQREYSDGTPCLTLIWDQVNSVNYLKHYGTGKTICDSSPTRVCYVEAPRTCESHGAFCVDLEVKSYEIFRFDSFQDAVEWGTDTDADAWPDHLEETHGSDPCDPASIPNRQNPYLKKTIGLEELSFHIRTLSSGKKSLYFQDKEPEPDNKVYWYRIRTKDPYGNASPLSPPARASLWDRSQPEVNGTLEVPRCKLKARFYDSDDPCENHCSGADHVLTILDETGLADRFTIYEVCETLDRNSTRRLILSKNLDTKRCITAGEGTDFDIDIQNCEPTCDNKEYIVSFSGPDQVYAQSDPFVLPEGLCEGGTPRCIVLSQECEFHEVGMDSSDDMPVITPNQPFNVCAVLGPGECAKIYRSIQGEFSAWDSFCNDRDVAVKVCKEKKITSIVATDVCLGLRLFSKNHVGSAMGYFRCGAIEAAAPPSPPLLEGIERTGSRQEPYLKLKWACQSEGICAFIIRKTTDNQTVYQTVWDIAPDAATGQYVYDIPIAPEKLESEFCFQLKARNNASQSSRWSTTLCGVWGEPRDTEHLRWPFVQEPSNGGELTAFYLNGEGVGALVLSGDLREKIQSYPEPGCSFSAEPCSGTTCLNELMTCNCNICGSIKFWNDYGRFVVYRQEENKAFVQVSPLVNGPHCTYYKNSLQCDEQPASLLDDPMIFLAGLEPGSVSGVDTEVQTDLEETDRLIFVDWYPHKAGSRIRYHLIKIGTAGNEPEEVYTSNWIDTN